MFLPFEMREPGQIRVRNWRSWLLCAPPYDRNATPRVAFVAYEHNDVLGFVAVKHDSIYAGYRADITGPFVLPNYRRRGIGKALMRRAAEWLNQDGIDRATVDCYLHDPTRPFFHRMGGFVIASADDEPGAVVTFGLSQMLELSST